MRSKKVRSHLKIVKVFVLLNFLVAFFYPFNKVKKKTVRSHLKIVKVFVLLNFLVAFFYPFIEVKKGKISP